MDKFQNKYRIPSARADWWNYSDNGAYFITICAAGKEHYFGRIINGEMILSEMGKIVQQEWDKSFEIRSELFCDAFVIMPNHIHAILRISSPFVVQTHGRASLQSHSEADASPQSHSDADAAPESESHGIAYRTPKSISSFVAGFKSAATKRINEFRKMPKSPVWHTRFHDHIIRNDKEFDLINKYIQENPANWGRDKFCSHE